MGRCELFPLFILSMATFESLLKQYEKIMLVLRFYVLMVPILLNLQKPDVLHTASEMQKHTARMIVRLAFIDSTLH